jgi:hypothetical protein
MLAPFLDLKNPNCVILGFIQFLELTSAISWQIHEEEAEFYVHVTVHRNKFLNNVTN